MTKPQTPNLKTLLSLLDDESPAVRRGVNRALLAYGPGLKNDVLALSRSTWSPIRTELEPIIFSHLRTTLRREWPQWVDIKDDNEQLQSAMDMLSRYLNGLEFTGSLHQRIEELAAGFEEKYPGGDVLELSCFLFREYKMSGAREDYYHPRHSHPVHAVEQRSGLPITLCIIYQLVASRLGMVVGGCAFPGHFLSRVSMQGKALLIDCYNQGRVTSVQSLLKRKGLNRRVKEALMTRPNARSVIRRVLANLIHGYEKRGEKRHYRFMVELYQMLESATPVKSLLNQAVT